jgi:hypothetical protein
MNRANPLYLIYQLPQSRIYPRPHYLVASWGWHRRYLAQEPPDRWEILEVGQPSPVESEAIRAGYRRIHPLESQAEAIYQRIRQSQQQPRRTPKQQAKFEARQQRQREQARLQAEWEAALAAQQNHFRQTFAGLSSKEIQRAYRRLAREHHPDIGGSADSFRLLESAYREALNRI